MSIRSLWVLFVLFLAMPQTADAKNKKDIAIQLYSVRDLLKSERVILILF